MADSGRTGPTGSGAVPCRTSERRGVVAQPQRGRRVAGLARRSTPQGVCGPGPGRLPGPRAVAAAERGRWASGRRPLNGVPRRPRRPRPHRVCEHQPANPKDFHGGERDAATVCRPMDHRLPLVRGELVEVTNDAFLVERHPFVAPALDATFTVRCEGPPSPTGGWPFLRSEITGQSSGTCWVSRRSCPYRPPPCMVPRPGCGAELAR